jgi:hypothetical protein
MTIMVSPAEDDLEYNFAKTAIERRTVRISCLSARQGRVLILTRSEMSQFRNCIHRRDFWYFLSKKYREKIECNEL